MTLMPRQLRVEYPGAIYHLLSRGHRKQDICLQIEASAPGLVPCQRAMQGEAHRMGPQLGEHHSGQWRQECAEAKGERIIAGELKGLKWKEEDLNKQSKGDPARLATAAGLRRESTLTIRQIAQRLGRLERPQQQALPGQQG
jgi:hypothetical protein